MDYTRYSALQSSTVCMPWTYLVREGSDTVNQRHILRLVARCQGWGIDDLHLSAYPPTLYISITSFFRGLGSLALTVTPAGSLSCGHLFAVVGGIGFTGMGHALVLVFKTTRKDHVG